MAEFSRGIRRWWMRVAGGLDQSLIYSEEKGFHTSGEKADDVHHVRGGAWAETRGERATDQAGLPVSRRRHQGRGTALPYCESSTFHSDITEAREKYRNGDREAYRKLGEKHKRRAERGGRYWGGDEATDRYYEERMNEMACRYVAETGDKRPQSGKAIPAVQHWTDVVFGKRSYREDEEE